MNDHDENVQLHLQVIELKKEIQLLLEENARMVNANIYLIQDNMRMAVVCNLI